MTKIELLSKAIDNLQAAHFLLLEFGDRNISYLQKDLSILISDLVDRKKSL